MLALASHARQWMQSRPRMCLYGSRIGLFCHSVRQLNIPCIKRAFAYIKTSSMPQPPKEGEGRESPNRQVSVSFNKGQRFYTRGLSSPSTRNLRFQFLLPAKCQIPGHLAYIGFGVTIFSPDIGPDLPSSADYTSS